MINKAIEADGKHFWIIQGGHSILRKINVETMYLEKQIKLKSPPMKSLNTFESDAFTIWMIIDEKYIHMNDKFIGNLALELKYGVKKLIYFNSVLLIAEKKSLCHIFELNEFYNLINHQTLTVFDQADIFDVSSI